MLEIKCKVHNVGQVLEDGRQRAIFLVPDLDDEATAKAMGVAKGTRNDREGSKIMLQHAGSEVEKFVRGQVVTVTISAA